ncbi:synaptonemal complex protein 2-like isoform X1 [Esox lucius]|uniref:synaptonemal complex protein 2-like isoform X1 n=1 Tax=Esox lucius TaxID=8010 RepID=UPI001477155B|nr:synaptonemal complex protein 2-like isoform X1 [Esox lucius]
MSFEISFEDAVINNNVAAISDALIREKASKSLVSRLNQVAYKELDRKEFKSVSMLLTAIEDVCKRNEDCFNCLSRQGLFYQMLMWFEKAVEIMKMDKNKGGKELSRLIEAFYDLFLRLSPSVEDRSQLTSVFLLRVGVVGTNPDIPFGLRLEAIRTINTLLDGTQKEERKKLNLSKDHCLLLEQFAKVILNVGDFEMQVALTEALCRMTVKKSREELANKWFANPVFAEGFNAIKDGEFETDCRNFLNDLNSYFGDERRVFTFPCLKVFLETTELFKPLDENLKEFWVDFNLGSHNISFFVNNPECLLWESIHVDRVDVLNYSLCDCDERTVLTVHLSKPIAHCNTKGRMVQISFDSKHDILDAAKRVFESRRLLQNMPSDGHASLQHVAETRHSDLGVPVAVESSLLSPAGSAETPGATQLSRTSLTQESETTAADVFKLDSSSNAEVTRAKARRFNIQFLSSGGSSPHSDSTKKEKKKQKSISKGSPSTLLEAIQVQQTHYSYTRKKPKTKSKLKSEPVQPRLPSHPFIMFECAELPWSSRHPAVATPPPTLSTVLPLSSPSSDDEAFVVKHFGTRSAEESSNGTVEELFDQLSPEEPLESNVISRDSGFPDVTGDGWHDSVFLKEEPMESTPKGHLPNEKAATSRKRALVSDSWGVAGKMPAPPERDPERTVSPPSWRPRAAFTSGALEEATESMTRVLSEEVDSETKLGSGVLTAFQNFKQQLREHFLARYKQIEAHSLQSLTDCQKHVTSLLGAVHNNRLSHLERFQVTVVQELGRLENDCISLKEIERETVDFWQSESQSVRSFCERQQERLDSLGEPSERRRSSTSWEAAAPSEPSS